MGKKEKMSTTHAEKNVRGRSQTTFLKKTQSLETAFPVKIKQTKPTTNLMLAKNGK